MSFAPKRAFVWTLGGALAGVALAASIVATTDYPALSALPSGVRLLATGNCPATIDLIRRSLNPGLELLGVLMTMYDGRTRLSAHVVDEVRRFFPDHLFAAVIPRSVRLAEAPSFGQVISEYDPSSRGATAYAEVATELRSRLAATS